MSVLGIDIGGTGIKGGLVDIATGQLLSERYRVDTPSPGTPEAVTEAVVELVRHFEYDGRVGMAFPCPIVNGVATLAANLDPSFVGVHLPDRFGTALGLEVVAINDADAAGVAEVTHGAAAAAHGTVLLLAFGTGIGSALFRDGVLVPNTELGHLELDGADAEFAASAKARKRDGLSYAEWVERVNHYLAHVEMLFSPDLLVFGGGVSKRWEKFAHLLETRAPIVPAHFKNSAGIAGAAMYAARAY